MVDLSKHLDRAKQALERRQYDLAIEICEECQEVDPTSLPMYRILVDAAKRRSKESGKKGAGLLGTMSISGFSKDPHKLLTSMIKRVAKSPDSKSFGLAGDAAGKVYHAGGKGMADVAILFYEEVRTTGLFSGDVLWSLATLYYNRFQETKEVDFLEKALKTMAELERAMPNHPEAGRTIKNWEAMRSMGRRNQGGNGSDYRSQLSSDDKARRQEAMNRMIRTVEDALEVLKYIDMDIAERPDDKTPWVKKGDVLRRIAKYAEAMEAYTKAQALDPHDFTITIRSGDLRIEEIKSRMAAVEAAKGDLAPLTEELLQATVEELRKRVERQPTEMNHRFNLAKCLIQGGNIEAAAAELQLSVRDPRLRKQSHRYLGYCFTKKNLLDLAVQQYTSYLQLNEDDLSDEAKEIRYARARLLEDIGRKDESADDFQRLVEIDLGYKDAAGRLSRIRGASV